MISQPTSNEPRCNVCSQPKEGLASTHRCPHGAPCDGVNSSGRISVLLRTTNRLIRSHCRLCLTAISENSCEPYNIEEEPDQ